LRSPRRKAPRGGANRGRLAPCIEELRRVAVELSDAAPSLEGESYATFVLGTAGKWSGADGRRSGMRREYHALFLDV